MNLWEIPATKDAEIHETYDAGIVLGGVITYDPQMDKTQFIASGDRLMHAIELYKRGVFSKIVFVGGSGDLLHPEFQEAVQVKRYLLAIGIPDTNIIIEYNSRNTHENAMNIKPILEKKFNGKNFLLITSAFHMRRSLGCFKVAGINVTPYSTDRMSGPWRWDPAFLIVPHANVMESWDVLLHEWLGMLMYKLAGYV